MNNQSSQPQLDTPAVEEEVLELMNELHGAHRAAHGANADAVLVDGAVDIKTVDVGQRPASTRPPEPETDEQVRGERHRSDGLGTDKNDLPGCGVQAGIDPLWEDTMQKL